MPTAFTKQRSVVPQAAERADLAARLQRLGLSALVPLIRAGTSRKDIAQAIIEALRK